MILGVKQKINLAREIPHRYTHCRLGSRESGGFPAMQLITIFGPSHAFALFWRQLAILRQDDLILDRASGI